MNFRDLLSDNIIDSDIVVKGFAYDKGCSVGKGARFAPRVICDLSRHLPAVTRDGVVLDKIKVFQSNIVTPKDLGAIYKESKEVLNYDKYTFFLGGDHSIAIATEAAFFDYAKSLGKTPKIIHFDAHPDFCDFYNGSNLSHACVNARAIDKGYKYSDIVLVGMRGLEKPEVELFSKQPDLTVLYTSELLKITPHEATDKILKNITGDDLVYISFDIDIFDPSLAPGTGTPEGFGMDTHYIINVLKEIFTRVNVHAMDIVEVSPKLDDKNNITSWLSLKMMYEVFGFWMEKKGK